jgi:hypothetical protein
MRTRGAIAATTALLVALIAVGVTMSSGNGTYTTMIDDGVEPALSAARVAEIAFADLERMSGLVGASARHPIEDVRLHAVRNGDVEDYEPGSAFGDGVGIVWIVRANATFVTARGRQPGLIVRDSGYLLIQDGSGEIIGMGMP